MSKEQIDISVAPNCQNRSESYDTVCVKCNKCGRFDKEKQIEEMARVLEFVCDLQDDDSCIADCDICRAEALYNAGYRKQSEGEYVRLPFKVGDTVWCLQKEDGEYAGFVGEMFLAVVGNAVITSAFIHDFANNIDEAVEYYIQETQDNLYVDLEVYPLCDCFATKEEVEKAFAEAKMKGETDEKTDVE